jgi:acyl-CoA thioester hydrolase
MTNTAGYETEIEVRFSDFDAYGHVNNAVFLTYMETARTKLLRDQFVAWQNRGLLFLVARAECDYRQPITFSDRVFVIIEIDRIGRSSFDLSYQLHNGAGRVFASARTVMVCFDAATATTVPVPNEFRQALTL